MIAGALLCSENVPRTRPERASAYRSAGQESVFFLLATPDVGDNSFNVQLLDGFYPFCAQQEVAVGLRVLEKIFRQDCRAHRVVEDIFYYDTASFLQEYVKAFGSGVLRCRGRTRFAADKLFAKQMTQDARLYVLARQGKRKPGGFELRTKKEYDFLPLLPDPEVLAMAQVDAH